eukprot:scaffold2636_cov176-Ochromonas_danica.AAC.1
MIAYQINPSLRLWTTTRTTTTTILHAQASVGSDALQRPEDENSPEFKEYLRQLLAMQANRAKTGFAAPSSGSSDAYFAKLTRLKLEKIARRKAGLPDDDIDTSYKPEDYQSAVYEMQEPPVTNGGVLTLDVARGSGGSSGNKVRALTEEELRMAKAAEESVKKALEEAQAKRKTASTPPETSSQSKRLPSFETAPAAPSRSASAVSAPPTIPKANLPPTPAPLAIKNNENTKRDTSSSSPLLKRKLVKEELEIVGKALEWTVKHRGGGPFGAGRLEGDDVETLENALRDAVQVLRQDSEKAVTEISGDSSSRKEENTVLPPLPSSSPSTTKKNIPPPSSAASASTPLAASQARASSIPQHSTVPAPERASPEGGVPIALGLDRFLQSPETASFEELDALRDGLIRVLGLIQDRLANIPSVAPTVPSVSQPPTERIISQYYEGSTDASHQNATEQDLKLALGLLLKHRGGPGFGHGRLQGKELQLLEDKLKHCVELLKMEAVN